VGGTETLLLILFNYSSPCGGRVESFQRYEFFCGLRPHTRAPRIIVDTVPNETLTVEIGIGLILRNKFNVTIFIKMKARDLI
tara:strand:- start:121 stop:366 length:246 start_codon:yes stop_codon:yes gene_type:complete